MQRMYGLAHAVIVPTTTSFVEGFNKVVAEAVLAGRPVITSSACPALSYVGGAAVKVPPDDVCAYMEAVVRLADDPVFYEARRRDCVVVLSYLMDVVITFGTVLNRALKMTLGLGG